MTPEDVGSCYDGTGLQCSTNYYCAYHDSFIADGRPVIYANEPYEANISACSSGSSPNGNDADSTINLISHEQNESITDPWGNAWQNADGEIADLCAWKFGKPIGGTSGVDEYNQVINGHRYWLQEEYSNDGSTCRQHYAGKPVPALRRAPGISGPARVGRRLSASKGTWSGLTTTDLFQWLRCNAGGGSCVAIRHATHASYRLTKHDAGHRIRVRVTAVNSAGRATATSRATARVSAARQ
jgi:hypothetical protein